MVGATWDGAAASADEPVWARGAGAWAAEDDAGGRPLMRARSWDRGSASDEGWGRKSVAERVDKHVVARQKRTQKGRLHASARSAAPGARLACRWRLDAPHVAQWGLGAAPAAAWLSTAQGRMTERGTAPRPTRDVRDAGASEEDEEDDVVRGCLTAGLYQCRVRLPGAERD